MPNRLLLSTFAAFMALSAPAFAFEVGSGSIDWKWQNIFNTATPNSNDRTFLGFLTRPGTMPPQGQPAGQAITTAPATGGPVTPASPRAGETTTFSFPAKATGSFDPATRVGSVEFDGQIRLEAPVGGDPDADQIGPFSGPESAAAIDDPRIVFDGTDVARLFGTGTATDGTAYDPNQALFNLTIDPAKITQTGATVTFKDVYPRIATTNGFVRFGFPAGQADRVPPTFGLMDITLRVAPPAITVTPVADLDPSGQTVTVSGTGATTANDGLYVYLSPQSAGFTDQNGAGNPPAFAFVRDSAFGPNGSFTTTITARSPFSAGGGSVDCTLVPCGVRTIAAHFVADRSQDTFTPVTFRQAYTVPTPTPTATATATATATPGPYVVPRPRLSKIALTRRKVSFTLSRAASVTGTVKRKGRVNGKKVRRDVLENGRRGRNAVKVKRLSRGRYVVRLKPTRGAAQSKTIRIGRKQRK